MIGERIAFLAGSEEEAAWLYESNGSQLTTVGGRRGRFADGTGCFTYRFDLPEDVTDGTVTLEIGNQFIVWSSTDGRTWTPVPGLVEESDVRDLSNLRPRTADLGDLLGGAHTLYLRVGDHEPSNGWGGWLASVEVALSG